MRYSLALLALAGVLALAPCARAEDPPTLDLLSALGLETDRFVAGVGRGMLLPCTVVDPAPTGMFERGQRVLVNGNGKGGFRVMPDAPGLTACVVGFDVHVVDLMPPARALRALGVEPREAPLAERDRYSTKAVDVEALRAHGLTPDGVGDLVSVHNNGSGRWSVSTFGDQPSSAEVDVAPYFQARAVGRELLAAASVVLNPETLPVGGRLLARAADPEQLTALGLRGIPEGHLVLVARLEGERLALTSLSPGFPLRVEVAARELSDLGLELHGLYELPEGASIQGRVKRGWTAARAGLAKAKSGDVVAVAREPDGGYALQNLSPRRPARLPLSR